MIITTTTNQSEIEAILVYNKFTVTGLNFETAYYSPIRNVKLDFNPRASILASDASLLEKISDLLILEGHFIASFTDDYKHLVTRKPRDIETRDEQLRIGLNPSARGIEFGQNKLNKHYWDYESLLLLDPK